MTDDIPRVTAWNGVNLEDMSKEQLIDIFQQFFARSHKRHLAAVATIEALQAMHPGKVEW